MPQTASGKHEDFKEDMAKQGNHEITPLIYHGYSLFRLCQAGLIHPMLRLSTNRILGHWLFLTLPPFGHLVTWLLQTDTQKVFGSYVMFGTMWKSWFYILLYYFIAHISGLVPLTGFSQKPTKCPQKMPSPTTASATELRWQHVHVEQHKHSLVRSFDNCMFWKVYEMRSIFQYKKDWCCRLGGVVCDNSSGRNTALCPVLQRYFSTYSDISISCKMHFLTSHEA